MIPEWFRMLAIIFLTTIMAIFFLGLIIIIVIVGREAVRDYIEEKRRQRR